MVKLVAPRWTPRQRRSRKVQDRPGNRTALAWLAAVFIIMGAPWLLIPAMQRKAAATDVQVIDLRRSATGAHADRRLRVSFAGETGARNLRVEFLDRGGRVVPPPSGTRVLLAAPRASGPRTQIAFRREGGALVPTRIIDRLPDRAALILEEPQRRQMYALEGGPR